MFVAAGSLWLWVQLAVASHLACPVSPFVAAGFTGPVLTLSWKVRLVQLLFSFSGKFAI